MEVFEGGGPLADFTDDIFPLLIMYTVQKSGAPLDTLPGTSPVLNFLLREKYITEATERKEQVFGLAVNLFAIRSCNLITDFVDGEIVSTCNRRDNRLPKKRNPSLDLKKPFLGSQENTTTTIANSPNSLHRCFSDPCSKPVANKLALQPPLDSSKMVETNAVSLPSQPALRRSVSDLSPNKSCSRSSSFKWLKKMKDSMKEINQLWDEIIIPADEEPPCENHEEDDRGTELENINAIMSDSETDCEESVTVERTGECLTIHFKCPCGKGYQFLLHGRNCYYKLM